MKISQLIQRLEEVRSWAGGEDLQVILKEHNGMFNTRLEVGGDGAISTLGEDTGKKVCVITSLMVLPPLR